MSLSMFEPTSYSQRRLFTIKSSSERLLEIENDSDKEQANLLDSVPKDSESVESEEQSTSDTEVCCDTDLSNDLHASDDETELRIQRETKIRKSKKKKTKNKGKIKTSDPEKDELKTSKENNNKKRTEKRVPPRRKKEGIRRRKKAETQSAPQDPAVPSEVSSPEWNLIAMIASKLSLDWKPIVMETTYGDDNGHESSDDDSDWWK
jgi:hypothetical protein